MIKLLLGDEQATAALSRALATTQPRPAVVFLHGDLGTGKSTLARAWLRASGVTGPVRSPTYTLLERYPLSAGGEAVHLDLYRIGEAAELEFLGLDEFEPVLWLVEWPDRGRAGLPAPDLEVHLAISGTGRCAELVAGTEAGAQWLDALTFQGALGVTF